MRFLFTCPPPLVPRRAQDPPKRPKYFFGPKEVARRRFANYCLHSLTYLPSARATDGGGPQAAPIQGSGLWDQVSESRRALAVVLWACVAHTIARTFRKVFAVRSHTLVHTCTARGHTQLHCAHSGPTTDGTLRSSIGRRVRSRVRPSIQPTPCQPNWLSCACSICIPTHATSAAATGRSSTSVESSWWRRTT